MFAKLFESQRYGQILVKLDTNDEEHAPEVRFYVQPKNLGVCSCAVSFQDDEQGWGLAEKAFDKVDLTFSEDTIKEVFGNGPIAAEFDRGKA